MAINTFATLKTAIANWLERDDLTSRIPEFVALSEDRIGRDLRVRAMETSADITISAQTASLPTSFLQMRRMYLNTDNHKLEFFSSQEFWLRNASAENGEPQIFTIEGENLVFGPFPATGSFTAKSHYYKKFDALSADADTNWILTNAVGLYLYGALIEASPFIEDDSRTLLWATMYGDALEIVQKADKRDRYPNASLRTRSAVNAG